jgi:hypothetical protein
MPVITVDLTNACKAISPARRKIRWQKTFLPAFLTAGSSNPGEKRMPRVPKAVSQNSIQAFANSS